MLNKDEVLEEEEKIRQEITALPDPIRKKYYQTAEKRIKDPDTYAVLNWIFIAGLHHFYLHKILRGSINIIIFIDSVIFLFPDTQILIGVGIGAIIGVTLLELNELFRSQLIIQDYNNKTAREILKEL